MFTEASANEDSIREISNETYVQPLSTTQGGAASSSRFVSDPAREVMRICQNFTTESTKRQDKMAYHMLLDFLNLHGYILNDLVQSLSQLDGVIAQFFASLRKKNGTKMKTNYFNSIKYALNRKLYEVYKIKITDAKVFGECDAVCKAVLKDLKKCGHGCVNHFEQMPTEDIDLVICLLDQLSPVQLQWLVFIYIQLYFCRRGQENIHMFTKTTFMVGTMNGRRFIYQAKDEYTKNHTEMELTSKKSAKIYDDRGKGNKCPVKLFEFYLSKLHEQCERLWQKPKVRYYEKDSCWYCNQPVGINTLQKFLPSICKFCKLDRIYTNHCLRVSGVSILSEKFTENEVRAISGHKSNQCLGIYKRLTEEKYQCMSDYISTKVYPQSQCMNNSNHEVINDQGSIAAISSSSNDFSNMPVLKPNYYDEDTWQQIGHQHSSKSGGPITLNNCNNVTINYVYKNELPH